MSSNTKWSLNDYFHCHLRREFVEDRLTNEGEFLIRNAAEGDAMVVSVLWKHQFRNCSPTKRRTQNTVFYSFGVREFTTMSDLVEYHYSQRIPFRDEFKTTLMTPIKCPQTKYKEAEIEVLEPLGSGNFGEVFKARILADNTLVAIKALRENVSRAAREGFQRELDMMRSMCHPNIVRYIGTVISPRGSEEKLKILLELVNQGSLEKLLRKGKVRGKGKYKICIQVAYGVQYLHRHWIIHRDLAARNILVHVTEEGLLRAKVSDFGLSRYDEHGRGYELKRSQQLPIKWMAPECFNERKWTMASDIWAYGILAWEVFTNGSEPYDDISESQSCQSLSNYISHGNHPRKTKHIGTDVWDLMTSCWQSQASERPSMDEVVKQMEDLYRAAF